MCGRQRGARPRSGGAGLVTEGAAERCLPRPSIRTSARDPRLLVGRALLIDVPAPCATIAAAWIREGDGQRVHFGSVLLPRPGACVRDGTERAAFWAVSRTQRSSQPALHGRAPCLCLRPDGASARRPQGDCFHLWAAGAARHRNGDIWITPTGDVGRALRHSLRSRDSSSTPSPLEERSTHDAEANAAVERWRSRKKGATHARPQPDTPASMTAGLEHACATVVLVATTTFAAWEGFQGRSRPDVTTAGLRRSTGDAALAAGQPTRARSRTIRTLLVRAWSRSIAAASSLGGDSVDQRLPTRRTSPLRSRSSSRASALSLFMPAARAAIAVENEPGSSGSAARRRSVRWSGWRCSGGAGGSGAAGTRSTTCPGWRPTGGSSPKRARQLAHKTTGSRPAGQTTSNSRHPRPE